MTAATVPGIDDAPTENAGLLSWVREGADVTTPDRIVWCDGSEEEWERVTPRLVEAGTFVRLTAKPNSFWARTDPGDVARVEVHVAPELLEVCNIAEPVTGLAAVVSVRLKLLEVIVAEATGSLNVAVTVVEVATLVAPSVGLVAVTVGGVVSTVQPAVAGVGSVTPLAVAATAKAWVPSPSPE